MRNILSDIPSGPQEPLSIPRELHRAFIKHEIPETEYLIGNAVWMSQHLHDYPVRQYTPLLPYLKEYCFGRLLGKRDYDYLTATKLGDWFTATLRAKEENESNMSLLCWAKEKCQSVGLIADVCLIEKALQDFMRVNFPWETFDRAMRVKVMDTEIRKRAG